MPNLNRLGFKLSINTRDRPNGLKEYYDSKKLDAFGGYQPGICITRYIEAKRDEEFWITCKLLKDGEESDKIFSFRSTIDGICYNNNGYRAGARDTGVKRGDVLHPYCFKAVQSSEEQEDGQATTNQIGEIIVVVRRGDLVTEERTAAVPRGRKRKTPTQKKEEERIDDLKRTVFEKELKGRDFSEMVMVGFGDPQPKRKRVRREKKNESENNGKVTTIKRANWVDTWERPYVVIRFIYMTRSSLLDQGLVQR
ncbi:hypothetical protein K440DRAFT_659734 [Wilcoxina mikolae CBS 423.85]|nr:hypothetical protein K440DRAFT_659734 [Wilcoxina mikolae CBS 423.85]